MRHHKKAIRLPSHLKKTLPRLHGIITLNNTNKKLFHYFFLLFFWLLFITALTKEMGGWKRKMKKGVEFFLVLVQQWIRNKYTFICVYLFHINTFVFFQMYNISYKIEHKIKCNKSVYVTRISVWNREVTRYMTYDFLSFPEMYMCI